MEIRRLNWSPRFVSMIFLLLLATFSVACGESAPQLEQTKPEVNLPWPPADDSPRSVSDDVFSLKGVDFDEANPGVVNGGFPADSVLMVRNSNTDPYLWATYSLGGFGSVIQFDSVAINFIIQPDAPENPPFLFIGMGNYDLGHWEWFETDTSPFDFDPAELETANYMSPGNSVHIAIVMLGVGKVWIEGLDFARVGDTSLLPPQNLQATAQRDLITLTWDDILTSEGYNVYRDLHKTFPAPELLNTGGPVTDPLYEDSTMVRGVMYFYRVTNNESGFESGPSGYVDIFAPESTRPLAEAIGGYSTGPDTYIAQWNWPNPFPDNFHVYFSEVPDFNLTDDGATFVEVNGTKDQAILDLKSTGDTIYWRVAAYHAGIYGQMTDDLRGDTIEVWEWDPVEVVGAGESPFNTIMVNGDVSMAYKNGGAIDFARRIAGTWDAELAMPGPDLGGFVGLSYSGAEYAIAAQNTAAHDLWAGYGTPGSWTSSRIHGDGAEGLGHPVSGVQIQLESTTDTHYLVHVDPADSIMLHTKPSGSGSWSTPTNLWDAQIGGSPLGMAEEGGNIFLLWSAKDDDTIKLADRDGGWVPANVFDTGTTDFLEFINLVRFDGEWWSPAYSTVAGLRRLEVHHGSTVPWTSETVRDTGQAGEYASMAALDTLLACTYLRRDADLWELALFNGTTWDISPLVVTGVDQIRQLDIMGFGDTPFIVFDDLGTGEIKAATGTPPAP